MQVLCNLLGKPPGVLFSELEGERSEFQVGDVQYHLGQQRTLSFPVQARQSPYYLLAICRALSRLTA